LREEKSVGWKRTSEEVRGMRRKSFKDRVERLYKVEGVEDMMKSQNREAEKIVSLEVTHRRMISFVMDHGGGKELGRCMRGIRGVV